MNLLLKFVLTLNLKRTKWLGYIFIFWVNVFRLYQQFAKRFIPNRPKSIRKLDVQFRSTKIFRLANNLGQF